jgi:protease-4
LNIDTVRKIADGRIFTGEMAKDVGLVDELGDFEDAVDYAARMVNIQGKPQLVYPVRKKFKMFEKFMDNLNNIILNRAHSGKWLNLSYLMYF